MLGKLTRAKAFLIANVLLLLLLTFNIVVIRFVTFILNVVTGINIEKWQIKKSRPKKGGVNTIRSLAAVALVINEDDSTNLR